MDIGLGIINKRGFVRN